ncbi:purple acid phosphatase 15-like isoform X3 [Typha latifolia]|uniref:purple acid phosphatase 15-like isoform X3 n=1 Tax=Typha latifolia TaxID=4733 RepID=UPI003C2B5591
MEKWAAPPPLAVAIAVAAIVVAGVVAGHCGGRIPTTLDGPFEPVTSPLDGAGFRGLAVDLPDLDPRVRRWAVGFEPEQISVSLSSTEDSVWISWVTGDSQIGQCIKPLDPTSVASVVRYGRLRRPLIHKAVGYSLVYNQLYPFEGLRNYTSGIIHHVRLTDLYLTNGTGTDCYHCTFKKTTPIHESYQTRWDDWARFMEPLISEVPIMVVEGNHEIEEQVGSKIFEAYSSRFAFPSYESGSFSTFYYSYNAGGIHFIMLGAYTSYNRTGEQYKWLERDLANVDRTVTPWLIATWHPPWYSTYRSHYKEAECMRVEMEELLYFHGVDIVFSGHVHAYERSNRVYNYTLDPCGPVYITIGDGGNRENMATSHADDPGNCPEPLSTHDKHLGGFCATNFISGPAAGKFCWTHQPDYSAYRESSFGHGILEVINDTHALWTWHRNQDVYNSAGDMIYIVRQPNECPLKPISLRPKAIDSLTSL